MASSDEGESSIIKEVDNIDHCKSSFDEIELTEDELNKLPARYRAWGNEISGKFQNYFISVTPPFLKFPYDDPKQHEYKLHIWNKTDMFLELDVEVPRCGVFQVYYSKGILFGGCVSTMIVRCEPKDIQLCTDYIRIGIVNQAVKPLIIPLELFPSLCWFSLPRIVVVPSVSIGKQIESRITLPSPHSEGRYYFIIKVLTEMDCFSVSPARGFLQSISSFDGIRQIIVKYTPVEYVTQVYTFQILFPEMPSFHPYEVNVYARCVPNADSMAIRMVTGEMEKLILKPKRPKTPEFRLTFPHKGVDDKNDLSNSSNTYALDDDLFTPAGIMRFLAKKGGKVYENRKTLGPLGLTTLEERRIYSKKERKFHNQLNRVEIQQKGLVLQHNRSFLGKDSILDDPEQLQAIAEQEEKYIMEYKVALGLVENDMNDLTRVTLQSSHQRSIRDAKEDFSKGRPIFDNELVEKDTKTNSKWAKKAAQRRFVQAALLIITRKRATKRLRKLRLLIEELSQSQSVSSYSTKHHTHGAHTTNKKGGH